MMISYVFSQTGLVAGGVVTGPAIAETFAQRAPVLSFAFDRATDRPHRRPEGR